MTWFTENPLPPVVIGIVIEALLVVGLAKTGKRAFLWGMIGTLALVVAAVIAERMIVTPREAVTAAIEEMRAALAANNRAELLTHIDPGNIDLRNEIHRSLAQLTVKEARIKRMTVTVDDTGTAARVDIRGSVGFEGAMPIKSIPVIVRADLRKTASDDKWLVVTAHHEIDKELN